MMMPEFEPLVEAVLADVPVDVEATVRGDEIAWCPVCKRDQGGFCQEERVHAVAVVVDRGMPCQHNIYELDGQYWVSGIYGSEPACRATIEEAKELVASHYDYRAAWEEYMAHNPPPFTMSNPSATVMTTDAPDTARYEQT